MSGTVLEIWLKPGLSPLAATRYRAIQHHCRDLKSALELCVAVLEGETSALFSSIHM